MSIPDLRLSISRSIFASVATMSLATTLLRPPFYVRDEIRQAVEFQHNDIVSDPLPGRFDLILYRNVEPFFDEATNKAVNCKLFEALEPGGLLFCSSVDRILDASDVGFERRGPGFFRKPISPQAA